MSIERPNVVLLVLDAVRRDALEPYGAPTGSSPAIAGLAERGSVLPHAYAAGSWTVSSHAAMFTGLLPREAGLSRAPGGRPAGCRPVLEEHAGRLLPAVLRERGYATAAVSTNLWLTERSGFAIGFDDFTTTGGSRQTALGDSSPRARARRGLEALRARRDDGAAAAGRELERWLGERPPGPFFWFANLIEAHSPYLPPKPFNRLGPIDRLRSAEEAARHLTMGEIWRACAGGFDVPAEALERMRALYADAVRYLDARVADLLERLDRAGVLDDTLVIVTADHGENLGEEGRMGHSYSLDQRLIHVPLLAAGPGAPSDPGAVSLAALPAMIAGAISLADHPWDAGAVGGGVAVSQFDPPGSDDDGIERALARWGLGEEARAILTGSLTSATDGAWKLVAGRGEHRFFDLGADPHERSALGADAVPGAVRDRLQAALDPVMTAAGEPAVSAGGHEAISEAERAELEDRMRLLGYL